MTEWNFSQNGKSDSAQKGIVGFDVPREEHEYKALMRFELGFTIEGDTLVKYKGKDAALVVPDGVRVIGASAFAGNPFLKSVVLPEGVEVIDRWAFYYCTSLREVSIPSTVKSIGEEAFRICRMLDSVIFPEGLESVAALTFSGCVFLRNVSLPASVKELGARAFLGCKRLEQVTLGERVVPPALLNNEFRPPLLAEEPFPVPAPRIIPPEIHVGWRAWLASGGRKNALDQQCCDFLRESGEKACAALGYHEETLKYLARNQLITREVALRAAAECSARGFVEATALLMELAQGLSLDDGLDL